MAALKRGDALRVVAGILISLSAGFVGSVFTTPSIATWYAALAKPSFSPPNWLFFPVWTTLYILMGIALGIIWSKGLKKKTVRGGVMLFGIQLGLNALWSVAFFGMHSPIGGLAVIALLWLAILATIIKFWKVSKTAGALMLPYIAWVSIASVLNFSIWLLNP